MRFGIILDGGNLPGESRAQALEDRLGKARLTREWGIPLTLDGRRLPQQRLACIVAAGNELLPRHQAWSWDCWRCCRWITQWPWQNRFPPWTP